MRTKTKRHVPAHDEESLTTTCDLCGAPCGYNDNLAHVEIKRVERNQWEPTGEIRGVDCCPACFDAKVEPALVALGFTVQEDFY